MDGEFPVNVGTAFSSYLPDVVYNVEALCELVDAANDYDLNTYKGKLGYVGEFISRAESSIPLLVDGEFSVSMSSNGTLFCYTYNPNTENDGPNKKDDFSHVIVSMGIPTKKEREGKTPNELDEIC